RLELRDGLRRQPVSGANRPVASGGRGRLHGGGERLTKFSGEKLALRDRRGALGGRAPLDGSQFLGGPIGLPGALVQFRDRFVEATDRGPGVEYASIDRERRRKLLLGHRHVRNHELQKRRLGRLLLKRGERRFGNAFVTP